jgi:hypothetical protein
VTGGQALFVLVRLLLLLLLLLLLCKSHVHIAPSVDHTQCTTTG